MAVSDILTFSTGAKLVVDPTGILTTVAANTPAYDYSTGRRRLLIEAAAATNYLGWGQSPGSTGWTLRGAATAVTGQVDPIGGSTAVRLSVGLFGSDDVYQIVSGGGASTRHEPSFFIKRISNSGKLNVYSPGIVGNWEIDLALIPDEWVRITRNHPSVRITQEFTTTSSNTIGLLFYAGAGTLAFDVWGAQIEKGERSTSLILTNSAAAVSRIADDVRLSAAALALVTGVGGCTIALRGSAPGVAAGQIVLGTGGGKYFMLANSSTVLVAWLGGNSTIAYAPSGTFETGFGACVAISPTSVSAAVNGSATAVQTVTPTTPSAVRLGADPTGSWAVPQLMIDELVIWPFAGSNAGVQAQARIYA